ncbi:uncharacterized protein ACHE_21142S [Aspergillus chevalieri]|uniref:Uncharacterized protein n=1 Tax=Aspergillus chevalieri TaxID=182096 RepID=A0A7R7ZLJ7_ASPCH|nr:uncharacterized protein ACHE_21142S [Aspergillus chevalieri]BCR85684.1 hypothetical protein ACHE_21142S [Aspergillus chevalieri]
MAKSARRTGKGKGPLTSSVSSSGASTPSSESGPLPPFARVPESLFSFVELLSPDQVYLIHIDTSPHDLKRQTFFVPSVMNAIIAVIIAVRLYFVRFFYPALLATIVGLSSPTTVDSSTMTWVEMMKIILYRTANVVLDYFLVLIFLPWPIRFIRGPVKWRRTVGFQGHEIIVRRSQNIWSKNLVRNRWIREDEASRDRIVAAVTPERLEKPGYMLVDADWDLDYGAMIRAQELVDPARKNKDDRVPLEEFRTSVLVNTDTDGWLIWRVGDESSTTTSDGKDYSEQRDQILAFREKLAAIGKEDLFFRWVEIIQYESTLPGGFTTERQQSAMVQAKQLFEEGGVDFSSLWREVGGIEGFLEQID